LLQEQVDREAIAITAKATGLTGRALAKTFGAVLRKIQNEHRKAQTPRGKQSVKKLMNHNAPTNTVPIEGDKGLFDKVARKWNVDYAFHKTGPDKYLLLFKTGQADAITACFSEYAALVMNRAKDKRPPVMEQFKKAAEKAARERPKHKERRREREAARE
jgi:hypothetical protein